jgi:predicted enzyme related to lactoylglutathione lyase
MGGTVHMEPMSMGGSRFAALADPKGAAFSIIKPPSRS